MGGTKLCLLLLMSTCSLAQQNVGNVEEQSPVCLLSKRFKNFRRFVYDYDAETFNGVKGATNDMSGPKVSCKVEVEVPQTCSFIIRTTECSLKEISRMDEGGNPVYSPAAGTSAFKAAMAKNALKITVEGQTEVKLYPEENEPVNILNIKRGIVSALMVPVMEEEKNKIMPTVHGVCPTDLTVNTRKDIATDVTISRDLSNCDSFYARRQTISPLALITDMSLPLPDVISSTQTCNYKFDNQKKYMTSGVCTEKHLFLPFSYKSEYGISTTVKQTVTLRETVKINDRVFDRNEHNQKSLSMEVVDDKSPVQSKDAVIDTMKKLNTLSETLEREERASIFNKLVSELRGLKVDVLVEAVPDMIDVSTSLTWQALVQCGTPECTSAMMKELRNFDSSALEVDAVVYALGMLPNPSRLMVSDMLEMAQYKQSKPIMYALSNVVRKLYQAEGVTPEINSVSQFMASHLGADCSGEKELTFLTLRVVGNMGDAMEAADPAIKTTLMKCMRQPVTTLSVQLAAIQAFRRMSVTDEIRSNLQRVSQYTKGSVQKRLAAYLTVMRNPQDSDIEMVKKLLKQEQNPQVKSFVSSHIYNIMSSTDPETKRLAMRIMDAMQDSEITTHTDYTEKSRHYKLGMENENVQVNMLGNVIFDPSSRLPREAMLETTLKAFGFNLNMWEVGMQGKGFEPTVDALFGENGFIPDTLSKSLYWAMDKIPSLNQVFGTPEEPEESKVPENLVGEIVRNFNKLVKDLQSQESPEAMAYLRIMGTELGYIKGNELKGIVESVKMYAEIFAWIIPKRIMANLMSSPNNEIFAHYIFMDKKIMLPTASGLPLTFALSGTFAPGAKGGLRFSPKMKELSFMPSMGVEFITQMGVHVPEFVASTVEMHTNIYHESALNAKISMDENQVKLSIPAPQSTNKLFVVSNKVMIVAGGHAAEIPHNMGEAKCDKYYRIKYCIHLDYTDNRGKNDVPYFPLNGAVRYSLDIEPTPDISEYTAAITYNLLNEGKDGRQKVDSLKFALRAEGAQPTEATATMKYNRNRNIFTTQVEIPDFDVEAGIKVGMTDSSSKGKVINIEVTNKNVPQLSLVGRAKFQAMTEGMMQLQLLVPSLKTDVAVTATVSKADGLTMQIKSDVKLPQTTSIQAVTFKYGEEEAEVQLMSNMNTNAKILVPYTEALLEWVGQLVEDVMDQQVVKTDMKLRHIFNKAVEAGSIWTEKITNGVPYIETLRNKMEDVEMPSLPENLYMNAESTFKYQYNKNYLTISVPLPLGGKSSEELRVPAVVTYPRISVSHGGMGVASKEIQVPAFTVPSEYDLTMPLMGKMELSASVKSNYYNLEASMSAGNNTMDSPNYAARFNVKGESPIELLSFSTEGATELKEDNVMKFTLDGSLNHMLLKSSFNVMETLLVTENLMSTGTYTVYAVSPIGLENSLTITTQFGLDSDMLTGDINSEGSLTVGSKTATTMYAHNFAVEPFKKEARMESSLVVNSDMLKAGSQIKASYANEELMVESNSNMNSDPIEHTTKMTLKYKDKLTLHSNSVTKAEERMLRSTTDFSAHEGLLSLRIENVADDTVNRASSVILGSLNPSALEINSDASLKILSNLVTHKATLSVNMDGLTTSSTTTAQNNLMTFENVFHGGVDTSGATMSLTSKGAIKENKAILTIKGKIASRDVYLNGIFNGNLFDMNTRNRVNLRVNEDGLVFSSSIVGALNEMRTENTHSLSITQLAFALHSKTDSVLSKGNSYMHEITVNRENYMTSVMVKNELNIMEIKFVNDALLKAEAYNMDFTGTLMGGNSNQNLKHTYEVKFIDMVLSAKCNTVGELPQTHMSHATEMEVAGLTMKLNDVVNVVSPYLRLDSTVKIVAAPPTLHIDAIFNSDGEVHLFGHQSGTLYSKFLLKAEPMLITNSFGYRASITHELDGTPTVKSSMDSKFNSMLSIREQTVTLKMSSKVDEHTFEQEMSAYNNAERMGVEMMGAVSTSLYSDATEDYQISGFVKYDKNSDSHFIQIPFIENLSLLIEDMMKSMMLLMNYSAEKLKDINAEEISNIIRYEVLKLGLAVDRLNFNLFVRDLKMFIRRIEYYLVHLTANFPTEKVMSVLKSIMDNIKALIKKYNIVQKFSAINAKVEEILSHYRVEEMIGAIMDKVVDFMKQYRVRERIQSAFATVKSINIQLYFQSMMYPAHYIIQELQLFNFRQPIVDMIEVYTGIVEKIKSFDFDTFTVELKDRMANMGQIPCFGKLYGEFRVNSPHYNLKTTADFENATTTSVTSEFKMNLKSQAESTLKVLDFTLDANAHVAAPKLSQLSITENINFQQSSFKLDHKGTMAMYGLSAQGTAKTTVVADTELYSAELVNEALFSIENVVSATVDTMYKHNLNMPLLSIFSDTSLNQKTIFQLEDGTATLNFENKANGKYAVQDFSDEGNHECNMEVVMDLHTAKVTFNGETDSTKLKMTEKVDAEISFFRHVIIGAKVEMETAFIKSSVTEMKFQAKTEDLKIDFSASHQADLAGQVEGTLSNYVVASVTPSEIVFDTKNKGNAKIPLPFSLYGKLDLQNDIFFSLNPEVQHASLNGLARFNQYKYSHYITMDNGDREIKILTQINGEANLDLLRVPITIPEIAYPFSDRKPRREREFTLWEDTGLKDLLITTQQSFDMSSKLSYMKNPETITIDINMEPLINAINTNAKALHKNMLIGKDKAAAMLASSYDIAKAEYEKYSIELPKTITVPAYKVPVMNVEVSTFTIPMPDISLITMPTLYIPSALTKITLPKVTLPKMSKLEIPVMGDLTYEFSMKTAVITLKTDASILNQDKFIISLDASSTSESEFFNGKISGNTNVDTVGKFVMNSVYSVKHSMLEGNHESNIIMSSENVSTAIHNSAKINLLEEPMQIVQQITGNPEDGLVVSMSVPSAGFIALQMQAKRSPLVKARLYGRYPSEPETDIDIFGLKMSVMDSEKLNLQTTWNMEMPNEVMLQMKNQVPVVMEMVSVPTVRTYNTISRHAGSLGGSFKHAKAQGKEMVKIAFNNVAAVDPSSVLAILTDNAIVILGEYRKRAEIVVEAVFRFLRETTFQIPGYEQKMSGFEVYQQFSAFVASVIEEAVEKIPEYCDSMCTDVIDYLNTIEFMLPGSNNVIKGSEILDDLFEALTKFRTRVTVIVRGLRDIKLKEILDKISAIVSFTFVEIEALLKALKSQKVDEYYTFVTDVYNDAANSPVMAEVANQVHEVRMIVIEYLMAVRARLQMIFSDMSTEQLQYDIQSWIDSNVKRVNALHNNAIKTLKETTKNIQPFVRVGDRQIDVDIPLPFVAKIN